MPLVIGGNSLNASPLLDQFNERQRFMQQQQQNAQHAQDEEQRQRDEAGRVKLQTQQGHDKDNNERARFLAQQNQAQQFHQDEQQHQQKQLDQQAQQADANRHARQDALDQQLQARQDAQHDVLDVRKQFLEQQTAGANDRAQTAHDTHLTGEMDRMTGAVEHAGRPDLVPRIAGEVQARDVLNQTDSPPDAPLVTGAEAGDAAKMNPFSMPAPIATELAQTQAEKTTDAATEKKEHHDQIESDKAAVRQTSQDLHTSTSAERKEKSHAALIDAAGKEPWPVWQKRATEAGMKPDDMTVHPFMQHLHSIDVDLSAIPPEQHAAYFENLAAKLEGKAPKDKTNSFYLADLADAKARVPSGSINENEHGVWKKDAIEYRKEIGKDLPSLREAIQQHIKQGPSGKPQGAPPSTPEPVPAAAPATPAALPKASTPEEVAKLPPGTHYLWKNGKEYVTK